MQNVRDFPQNMDSKETSLLTIHAQNKLNNGKNSPFLLNEHGDPPFLFQVFAKTSLMKNIFEEGKKFDSRT